MNHLLLSDNQKKRLEQPLWMLLFFAMFSFWQMGFIYFMGPALTINGRTPLPISMDNVATLIVISYVLSILWLIFLPHLIILTQRLFTSIALLTAIGLFLPLTDDILKLLIYTQIFCCCFMIGFESFIMINFFTERSNIVHLTIAYGIALFLIAAVQNDFVPITFPIFRLFTVLAIVLLLIFLLRMPAGKEALPRYVKKSDGIPTPKKLLFGTYVLVFVGALMAVSGPSISGEFSHGVFVTYLTDALASLCIYFLYQKKSVHPIKSITLCIGLGAIGYLFILGTAYVPALALPACGLIGVGMVPCQMLPLYGSVLMKSYPSKYITPIIIGLALAAVLVQSGMVEIFRSTPNMLYFTYAIIMGILVIIYLQIEPIFLFTLQKKITSGTEYKETSEEECQGTGEKKKDAPDMAEESADPLTVLSKREREVVELICLGYSNADIAKVLFISEHTVKDHTKKIYPKMGVHSRFELATLVNRYNTGN